MKKIVGTETTNYKSHVFKSQFNNLELRIFENRKIFWFVANEVAKILEYKQFDNSIARIVEDRNKKYYKDIDFYSSLSGLKNLLPNSILITKDGINNIISRSRSKNIKTFKEWIMKDVFPNLVDDVIIEKKDNTINDFKEFKEFKLKLLNNDILDIAIRKDGYINATQLCKAGKKLFGHYQTSKQTQDYLQALSSIIGIPIMDLFDSKVGGSHSGTYVHRKVAYHLAQWISPSFAIQVYNLIEESKNKIEKLPLISNHKFPLVLNSIEIKVRQQDGYINLTSLCKAGNKEYFKWNENKKTEAFLQALTSSLRIRRDELIKFETGSNENRATWGHPQVAINISQWISPQFDVQVSKWIFELMLTGKVEIGKEKTDLELENIYKDKLGNMENQLKNTKEELKTITYTHNSMLKRQRRTVYELGNVIYIVSNKAFTMYFDDDCHKFGKATQKKNEKISAFMSRLSTYNTSSPINFDVDFLMYIKDNDLIENNIKARFRKDINPVNKEWLKGVELNVIINYITSFCDLTNLEYKVVIDRSKNISNLEEFEENEVEENENEEEKEEVEEENEEEKKIEIEEENEEVKNKVKYQCKDCKRFNVSEKRADRCTDCNRISSRKVIRPSYEQLLEDSKNMSIVAIGKKYGVSDNAIRKWINVYKKK